jgi:hypothetical protein
LIAIRRVEHRPPLSGPLVSFEHYCQGCQGCQGTANGMFLLPLAVPWQPWQQCLFRSSLLFVENDSSNFVSELYHEYNPNLITNDDL